MAIDSNLEPNQVSGKPELFEDGPWVRHIARVAEARFHERLDRAAHAWPVGSRHARSSDGLYRQSQLSETMLDWGSPVCLSR